MIKPVHRIEHITSEILGEIEKAGMSVFNKYHCGTGYPTATMEKIKEEMAEEIFQIMKKYVIPKPEYKIESQPIGEMTEQQRQERWAPEITITKIEEK